jgi:hypothetical protein
MVLQGFFSRLISLAIGSGLAQFIVVAKRFQGFVANDAFDQLLSRSRFDDAGFFHGYWNFAALANQLLTMGGSINEPLSCLYSTPKMGFPAAMNRHVLSSGDAQTHSNASARTKASTAIHEFRRHLAEPRPIHCHRAHSVSP